MLNIKQFGVEVEFHSNSYSYSEFAGINFPNDKNIFNDYNRTYSIGSFSIPYKLSKEFYSNTIEWNLGFKDYKDSNIQGVVDVVNNIKKKYNLELNHKGPGYVGTHIHLLLEKNGIQVNKNLRNKKLIIFYVVYKYLLDKYKEYFQTLKPKNLTTKLIYELYLEFDRLSRNHNILIYFDKHFLDFQLRKNIQDIIYKDYIYTNGIDIPKYQPVLWSNPIDSKPLTLEVRIIPNSIFFHKGWLDGLLHQINLGLNTKIKIKNIIRDIDNVHKEFCAITNRLENIYKHSIDYNFEGGYNNILIDHKNYMFFKDNIFGISNEDINKYLSNYSITVKGGISTYSYKRNRIAGLGKYEIVESEIRNLSKAGLNGNTVLSYNLYSDNDKQEINGIFSYHFGGNEQSNNISYSPGQIIGDVEQLRRIKESFNRRSGDTFNNSILENAMNAIATTTEGINDNVDQRLNHLELHSNTSYSMFASIFGLSTDSEFVFKSLYRYKTLATKKFITSNSLYSRTLKYFVNEYGINSTKIKQTLECVHIGDGYDKHYLNTNGIIKKHGMLSYIYTLKDKIQFEDNGIFYIDTISCDANNTDLLRKKCIDIYDMQNLNIVNKASNMLYKIAYYMYQYDQDFSHNRRTDGLNIGEISYEGKKYQPLFITAKLLNCDKDYFFVVYGSMGDSNTKYIAIANVEGFNQGAFEVEL